MPNEVVLVLEDSPDVAMVVSELLADAAYDVRLVGSPEELLEEAGRGEASVALVDSADPSHFDLWWVGPRLVEAGVRPIVFSAHSDIRRAFRENPHGFVGIVPKPFDVDELLRVMESAREGKPAVSGGGA
ncbi:MAG TPA: response regulator [Chloroflexota bacterium]|nr:response regulator [Chloroflexota bacterium]